MDATVLAVRTAYLLVASGLSGGWPGQHINHFSFGTPLPKATRKWIDYIGLSPPRGCRAFVCIRNEALGPLSTATRPTRP
jgi:hypothetical protein